jgi:hypothetical protein
MANYLFAYKGGGMAGTDKQRGEQKAAWGQWFGTLGAAVVDGGNPCGASKTVARDGSIKNETSGVSGYSVIKADSLDAALKLAKGCPLLKAGGSVEVYETINAM